MEDFFLEGLKSNIGGNKNKTLIKELKLTFFTWVKFYQDHNLIKKKVVDTLENLPEDAVIMKSDLTDDGFELYKTGVQKWYDAHDRGRSITDISLLEKYLKKIRNKKKKNK